MGRLDYKKKYYEIFDLGFQNSMEEDQLIIKIEERLSNSNQG